jgi:hypothetical protein
VLNNMDKEQFINSVNIQDVLLVLHQDGFQVL